MFSCMRNNWCAPLGDDKNFLSEESLLALQYPDDTALIANAEPETVATLKIMLRLFMKISGLEINHSKSTFVQFNLSLEEMQRVKTVLDCPQTQLPVTYLDMPLTTRKPDKQQFIPLVEKLEKKFQGWKGKLILRGGRLQLVTSVLSSIPIYYMNCFHIPKWVFQRIDKVRRLFLWGKNDRNRNGRGISLLNWPMVCTQKIWGGLGVPNLEMQNLALLLRWWWRAYVEPTVLWTIWINKLRTNSRQKQDGPRLCIGTGSFFWLQLLRLKYLFHRCTDWLIGDGSAIAFWFDSWDGAPLKGYKDGNPRPVIPSIALKDALTIFQDLLPTVPVPTVPLVPGQRDKLVWRWGSSVIYTAKETYDIFMAGGRIKWKFMDLWTAKCPHTVKIFVVLMLQEKILTHDVLIKRHINCQPDCVMCRNCSLETAIHLLFLCPYARQVWYLLSLKLGLRIMVPTTEIQELWEESKKEVRRGNRMKGETWTCWFVCTVWAIWKQRNAVIFRDDKLPPNRLASKIALEVDLWLNFR